MATVTRRTRPKTAVAGQTGRRRPNRRSRILVQVSALTAAILGLWALWSLTATTVEIEVDGVRDTVQTHRRVVGAVLSDVGLLLGAETEVEEGAAGITFVPAAASQTQSGVGRAVAAAAESGVPSAPEERLRISPNLDTRVTEGLRVSVERPQQYRILADGRDTLHASWAESAADVFAEAGIPFSPRDQLLINREAAEWDAPLPQIANGARESGTGDGPAWELTERDPLRIEVNRSVRLTVYEDSIPYTIHTLAETVGEALREAEITIYLGDEVQPSLGTPVSTGLRVLIQRSTPVSLLADGVLYRTRTQSNRVGDVLAEVGVGFSGLDEVYPPLDAELYPDMQIQIVRVREEIEFEDEIAPFDTLWEGDRDLLIDTLQERPGAYGITRERYRVLYRDGEEVARTLEDVWEAQEPRDRVRVYGQKIVPRTFVDDTGEEFTYWRVIRMRATSYSAATAGVSPSVPWYGYTRTGDRMRKGVVAVDPAIVPLRTRVYVPGYGIGDALDTGGNIRNRRIDLGYDDHNLVLWSRWVDVYLLWPPPPESEIQWVIPLSPIEPR